MKKNNAYFEDFIEMACLSCKAAEYLLKAVKDFEPKNLEKQREEMHKIEHAADEIRHALIKRLVKEFVPPIDREDIIQLVNELDDVTDKIEDILIRIYMYNITVMKPEAIAFCEVILRSCKALHNAMMEFPNFHRSAELKQAIIDVNTMEEEGDKIYIDAVRALYKKSGDPLQTASWSELFDRLEDCCDVCEHVADMMETIAMKNS